MINFRDLYHSIFKQEKAVKTVNPAYYIPFSNLNDGATTYSKTDIRDSITYNTIIKTIAKHVAKLTVKHVTVKDGKETPVNSNLQTLLELRPNAYMSTYDFIYKTVICLLKNNNAYISIQRDLQGNILSLYPLEYETVEQKEVNGDLYLTFRFTQGKSVTYPYSDIIHLRYDWIQGDIISKESKSYLLRDLELLETLKDSFAKSAANSGGIKGIAKIAGVIGETKWNEKAANIANQIKANNGIVCTDQTTEVTPTVNANPVPADTSELSFIRGEIYRAMGVSEKIIEGDYTEQEYNSFFESTIKPIAIAFSQEFTSKIFTAREIAFGNRIIFGTSRLEYTDTKTKVEMIKELRPLGILSTNDSLSIMGLPPVENGDDRIQSLNHVNTDLVNEYQTGKKDAPPKESERENTKEENAKQVGE